MHTLVVGITGRGKTTLCFTMAASAIKKGTKIIVLDPDLRQEWEVPNIATVTDQEKQAHHGVMTDDPVKFLEICKNSTGCILFIDESGSMIGRYDEEMFWLATQSRKWGHKSVFIMQRAKQVSPTVRGQCDSCFAFTQSTEDAKILCADFASECFLECPHLKKGEYIYKIEDKEPGRSKAW